MCVIQLPFVITGLFRKLTSRFWYYLKNSVTAFFNFFLLVIIMRVLPSLITSGVDAIMTVEIILWVLALVVNGFIIYNLINQVQKESMLKQYDLYKSMAQPLLNELRSRQHDINNHFQVISQAISTVDPIYKNQLEEYTNKIHRDLNIYSLMLKTPNPMLGALLHSKKIVSERKCKVQQSLLNTKKLFYA